MYGKSNNYNIVIHNFAFNVSAAKGVCVNIDIVSCFFLCDFLGSPFHVSFLQNVVNKVLFKKLLAVIATFISLDIAFLT